MSILNLIGDLVGVDLSELELDNQNQATRSQAQSRRQPAPIKQSYISKTPNRQFGVLVNEQQQRSRLRRDVTIGPSRGAGEKWKITNQLKPWLTANVKKP
ncbi:MAG: hypothetical protein LBT80_03105 [Lactobacillaceae bacterium]|jgi:hypothetical protein|nr:hypothetical protein [Lactobacillaceae bacterium]